MAKDKEKPELPSQDAKEKIKAGEELNGVYIERLNLSKMELGVPLQIVDCVIGILDLNGVKASADVSIRRCRIEMCVLSEAHFQQKFDFRKNSVGRGRIQRAHFEGVTNFSECTLAYTSFHQSQFGQKTDFSRCSFVGDGTFTEVTFQDNVKFIHSEYLERGIYHRCMFMDVADFKHITVAKDLEFNDSTFQSELLCTAAVIQLSLNLQGANLDGKTDFANITVGRNLSLLGVAVGENQGFRFMNANANPIVFQRDIVDGHIWAEREGDFAAASREYGFLRTAFAQINRFEDEDWAYYQFKRSERRSRPLSANPVDLLMRAGNYVFLDIGCGYGTRPFRTLAVIGLMVMFFAMCYLLGGVSVPPDVNYGLNSPTFNKVMHSIYSSLLAFSGGLADIKVNGFLRWLAMLEYLFGVVFMGLFIVAFSRKVIR